MVATVVSFPASWTCQQIVIHLAASTTASKVCQIKPLPNEQQRQVVSLDSIVCLKAYVVLVENVGCHVSQHVFVVVVLYCDVVSCSSRTATTLSLLIGKSQMREGEGQASGVLNDSSPCLCPRSRVVQVVSTSRSRLVVLESCLFNAILMSSFVHLSFSIPYPEYHT